MERYSRQDVAVVIYHLHIPAPDPMTNPSTEARAKSYEVRGTPSYAIDGKMASGGGGRDEAKSCYDRLNPQIEKRLEEPSEARLSINAFRQGGTVKVKATVDNVRSKSSDLKLQVALVEEQLTYSGEGGLRFHPMVVRSLGGEKSQGFTIDRLKSTTIEHTFDLGKITKELKAHLDDYEKENKRTFSQKKHEIDGERLAVAAFVQDTKSKQVLQAVFVKAKDETVATNR